jgi:hypothetical protein
MFRGVVAIGSDAYESGGRTVGSIWVDRMKLAGE